MAKIIEIDGVYYDSYNGYIEFKESKPLYINSDFIVSVYETKGCKYKSSINSFNIELLSIGKDLENIINENPSNISIKGENINITIISLYGKLYNVYTFQSLKNIIELIND